MQKVNNKNNSKLHSTIIFFIVGFLLIVFGISLRINTNSSFFNSLTNNQLINKNSKKPYNIPISVQSPRLAIEKNITPVNLKNNKWEIAQNGGSYLIQSARPGENGPIIIYGHNTNKSMYWLHNLKSKDIVIITLNNKDSIAYKVQNILKVKPTDTNVLSSKNKETLVLYTCTGFADLYRLVVKAYRI